MVEVMKMMVTSFTRSHDALMHTVPPTLQQATADLCLPRDSWTHGQVWVSLLWGRCSFLLGPGAHNLLFMHSKSQFTQSCESSGSSVVGLMVTSSKEGSCHTQVC